MAFSQRILYEVLRSVDTATASSYVALGSKLANPGTIIKMVNLSNKDLLVSIDGVNAHDICPTNGFFLYDLTANSTINCNEFEPAGTQFYVKTSDGAAGTGLVYLVVKYIYQL